LHLMLLLCATSIQFQTCSTEVLFSISNERLVRVST